MSDGVLPSVITVPNVALVVWAAAGRITTETSAARGPVPKKKQTDFELQMNLYLR